MPFGKIHYMKALEERVAELESYLTKEGRQDVGSDHWQYLPRASESIERPVASTCKDIQPQPKETETQPDSSITSEDPEERDEEMIGVNMMVGVLRDLSLDANGGYMGATSHITIGRLVGSIVKGKNSARASSEISSVKDHIVPKLMTEDDHEYTDSAFTRVPAHVADRMLTGYIQNISTAFPVIHSVKVKDIHARRYSLEYVFQHHPDP